MIGSLYSNVQYVYIHYINIRVSIVFSMKLLGVCLNFDPLIVTDYSLGLLIEKRSGKVHDLFEGKI